MISRLAEHTYIALTIFFTVYSQLVMRWQVGVAGAPPADAAGKAHYIGQLLLNPWVITGILATFLAGVSWMLAMTKFEISYAFPYISLNFVLVLFASVLLFGETLSMPKIAGTALIIAGIAVIAKG
jgi:multidrug transporter EmrE-like cation transporter